MISLKVKKYCENCPDFKAEIDRSFDVIRNIWDTYVYCENRNKCKEIAKCIERYGNGDKNV